MRKFQSFSVSSALEIGICLNVQTYAKQTTSLSISLNRVIFGRWGSHVWSRTQKYWSAKYKVDEKNMCVMSLRCLFIVSGNRRILVDNGLGNKHASKLKFFQPFDQKDIRDEIRKIGYEPEEVTDVILTHLHFDHCGGSTVLNESGKAVPTYPNATYHLSLKQWQNYRNPSLFEKAHSFPIISNRYMMRDS